jgi:hypothetical protein
VWKNDNQRQKYHQHFFCGDIDSIGIDRLLKGGFGGWWRWAAGFGRDSVNPIE